jgi:perosamine synthetase
MNRITDLEKRYVLEVLDNDFHASKNHEFNSRLENHFAELFNVGYAIAMANGTATLHTALAALGIGPGDEVIVPPLTMASTSLCVLQAGAVPVFADVDAETFNIDAQSILSVITKKTRAIICVGLYGLAPDYERLVEICRANDLFLIEDNAQCFLAQYKGTLAGCHGDFASFSFQASKHLTAGEGGMLITNNPKLAEKARRFSCLGYAVMQASKGEILKTQIQDPSFERHSGFGYNYRMSDLCAAVCLAQLERAEKLVKQRQKVANLFKKALNGSTLFRPQAIPDGYQNTFWTYAMVLQSDRPETKWYRFRDQFLENGGNGFYAAWKLTYEEPFFQKDVGKRTDIWQSYQKGLCPVAEFLQPRLLQLKTNYWNTDEARRNAKILQQTIQGF